MSGLFCIDVIVCKETERDFNKIAYLIFSLSYIALVSFQLTVNIDLYRSVSDHY